MLDLHQRTKIEMVLVTARSQYCDFFCPSVISTSINPERYFYSVYRQDISEFAQQLESHMLSGGNSVLTGDEEFKMIAKQTVNEIETARGE